MKELKRSKYQLIIILTLLISGMPALKAQDEIPSLDNGSIENRFNYVLQKSNDFEEFKMVKRWMLYRLKSHVLDSLKEAGKALAASQNIIAVKNARIDSLSAVIDSKNASLSAVNSEKDSIQFFGAIMSKNLYNTILWTVISILTFLLLIFAFLFRRSNSVTVRHKKALAEVRNEYDAYRKKALEREQKVVRELYDEILKYKNKSN